MLEGAGAFAGRGIAFPFHNTEGTDMLLAETDGSLSWNFQLLVNSVQVDLIPIGLSGNPQLNFFASLLIVISSARCLPCCNSHKPHCAERSEQIGKHPSLPPTPL